MRFGTDITNKYCGKKYEPPVRLDAGDAERESFNFPRYTNIENIQRYPYLIEEGTEVVITEKIHGTNVRMGFILDDTPEGQVWKYAAGSHGVRRKADSGLYWKLMDHNVMTALVCLHDKYGKVNVVIYGEIFGNKIQDLDYGCSTPELRMFDISIDGKYMDYEDMLSVSWAWGIPTVPELYRGPFSIETVEEHTYGKSTFQGIKSKFKGREGCVIKPVIETADYLRNRVILKSVSADYRNRKGARDEE